MVEKSEAQDSGSTAINLDAENEGEQELYGAHHRVAKETRKNRWPVAARNENKSAGFKDLDGPLVCVSSGFK